MTEVEEEQGLLDSKLAANKRNVVVGAVTLATVSVACLVVFWNADADSIGREVAKIAANALLVVLGGLVLGLLSHDYQSVQADAAKLQETRLQQAEEARDQALRLAAKIQDQERRAEVKRQAYVAETLDRATEHYMGVKRCRRLIRARARESNEDDPIISLSGYDRQMGRILDHQLSFERLKRDVETNSAAFAHPQHAIAFFRDLEEYLGPLVTEYEDNRPGMNSSPAALSSLATLTKFLTRDDFHQRFAKRFKDLTGMLRQDCQPRQTGSGSTAPQAPAPG